MNKFIAYAFFAIGLALVSSSFGVTSAVSDNTSSTSAVDIDDLDERVGLLESWKASIDNLLNDVWDVLSSLSDDVDDHESRIQELEGKVDDLELPSDDPEEGNETPDYWKYLKSSDRRNIVCGVASDDHMDAIIDLGWNCTVSYKNSSRGEKASCKCKQVEVEFTNSTGFINA